ncbi:MAG: amino acid permease [Myxococcales bacterium]|nr:amino acid permease [Myxococcales bacterium]
MSETKEKEQPSEGMGVIGAAAIGIGGMVGGGIFAVLGTAATMAGGGTPVAFAIAGVVALLTAYCYAKLSVAYPESGGTIVYLDRAFGVDLLTGALNSMLWLSYLVTIALYASAFGSYALTFFDGKPSWLLHVLMTAAIVVPAVINVLNSAIVSKSETAVVVIKLTLLALVIGAGAKDVDLSRLTPSSWADPLSLVMAGMTIFVAYEGFELIANAAEDVKEPAKTLPRAFYLSVGFVVILYILVAIVTVGSLPADKIAKAEDYALAAAAEPSLGHVGFVIVAVSALLATFSAINATVYGNARLGYALAKDGELPKVFQKKTWSRPLDGVALTALLASLLANLVDLKAIAILGSAGFLILFAAVNAAALRLGSTIGAKRVVCAAASLACVGALGALLWHTYSTEPQALWVLLGLVGVATLFELVYPRISGRHLGALKQAKGDDG